MNLLFFFHVLLVINCFAVFENNDATSPHSTYPNFTKSMRRLRRDGYSPTSEVVAGYGNFWSFMNGKPATTSVTATAVETTSPTTTITTTTTTAATTTSTLTTAITTSTPTTATNNTNTTTSTTATDNTAATATSFTITTFPSTTNITSRSIRLLSWVKIQQNPSQQLIDGIDMEGVLVACILGMAVILLILFFVVTGVLIRRHRSKKRQEKKNKQLLKKPRQMEAADIYATKFAFGGALVLDSRLKGPVEHACQSQETATLKTIEFDPNLNEIVDIGSNVEIIGDRDSTADEDKTRNEYKKTASSFESMKSLLRNKTARRNPAFKGQLKRAPCGNEKSKTTSHKRKPVNVADVIHQKGNPTLKSVDPSKSRSPDNQKPKPAK